MLVRHPTAAGLVLALVALAACSDRGVKPAPTGDTSGAGVTFTLSGTSFAGTVDFDGSSALPAPTPQAFYRLFTHGASGTSSVAVKLLVPSGVYRGVGTYACGTELAKTVFEAGYCTITVEQSPDASTTAQWTTNGVELPGGGYGALPGCTITITEAGATVRGAVSCSGLAYHALVGTHPDAGRPLGIAGSFEVTP
jgi:hypothetical protein